MEQLASDTSSFEGGRPFSAEPHGWGISGGAVKPGEFTVNSFDVHLVANLRSSTSARLMQRFETIPAHLASCPQMLGGGRLFGYRSGVVSAARKAGVQLT